MANKDYVKSQQAKEGSINSLRVQLKALQNQYDAMASAERESARGTDLIKHLKDVDAELKKLEAGSGRFQRNVGNYASGWSPLSNAIGQITRELPNFGQSLQIGVMSLTNNIGALQDAIKGINEQNKVLKSEGKTTTSALSQIAGALFSWNTVLYVGVGLLSAYSDEIFDFIGDLFKSEDAIRGMTTAQKDLEKIMGSSLDTVSKEISHLKLLYSTATDVTISNKERKNAVDELQTLYPHYFANLKDEIILNGLAKNSYDAVVSAILSKARVQAGENELAKREGERLIERESLLRKKNVLMVAISKMDAEANSDAILSYSEKIKQIDKELKLLDIKATKEDEIYISMIKAEKDKAKFLEKDFTEIQRKKLEAELSKKNKKDTKEKTESSTKEVNRINDIKKQYEREQKELDISLGDKLITEEEYYYKSILLTSKFIAKRNGLSKKETETQTDFNLDLEKKANDFHDKLINNSLKELEVSQYVYGTEEEIVKAKQDAIKKKYKETYDNLTVLQKNNQKLLDDIQEKQKKKLEEYYAIQTAKQELTDKAIEASAEIASTITDRLIYNAERLAEIELKRVDAQEEAELASLDRLTLSENERAERKKVIELEAEARRKAIEKEKIKDLRKFATIQKAIDVAQIISSTALSIMRALEEKGVPFPVKIANSIGFGITGAVQLAKVLATPLPQYAEGIESTPTDSFAIVGEKGTELITEKSGKQYLTPNRDTLTYLPKGTKVTPHHELMANVYDNAHKYMASNSSVTTDTMQTALIQSFEELYNKVDNLTEIMAKKNMNVSIFGDYEHAMRIKKSRM